MSTILQVKNLRMRFGAIAAADNINVAISEGEFASIIGPNGSGKTTFLNLITGFLTPQDGRIFLGGEDITGLAPFEVVRRGVARSFQIPQVFLTLPVLDNVLLALAASQGKANWVFDDLKTRKRIEEAHEILARFRLDGYAERPAQQLPAGSLKILDVAMAFALRPMVLLMDEPTSGVSAEEKFAVMDRLAEVLRNEGVTTIFVEHDMEVVRKYAERVLVFLEGKIVADGQPKVILEDPEIRRTVSGWWG